LPKSPRSPIAATEIQKIDHFLDVAGGGDPGNLSDSDLGNTSLKGGKIAESAHEKIMGGNAKAFFKI